MIDEKLLWACAQQLTRRHEAGAWSMAAKRAALLADGEIEGHHVFPRILERVRHIEAPIPEGRTH